MVLAMKRVLHVGSGWAHIIGKNIFTPDEWEEIRLDINPNVQPDIVANMTDMSAVETASMDAVYSCHNLEHLYPFEVYPALDEFRRVLKPEGFALIIVPDLQEVAKMVAKGDILGTAYNSSAGPIAPLDMLYGHRPSLAAGNLYMAHKMGFTQSSLETVCAGWKYSKAKKGNFTLAIVVSNSPLSKEATAALNSVFKG